MLVLVRRARVAVTMQAREEALLVGGGGGGGGGGGCWWWWGQRSAAGGGGGGSTGGGGGRSRSSGGGRSGGTSGSSEGGRVKGRGVGRMNVLFIPSSSDPSFVQKKTLRSSAAIYMYVTESMINFLPLSFFKQSAKPLHVNPQSLVLLNFYLFFAKCNTKIAWKVIQNQRAIMIKEIKAFKKK